MPRTLIVPLDGSELAETALPWATLLAERFGLSLVLHRAILPVYLVAPGFDGTLPYLSPETYERLRTTERETATAYLAEVQTRLQGDGVIAAVDAREGAPADTLLDVADERGAAIIVLATHGRGGLTRLVMGSVAERVVAQANVPLLLVRPQGTTAAAPDLHRLLVPLDGSPLAERALDLARELAPADGALVLFRAVTPIEHAIPAAGVPDSYVDTKATKQAVDDATAYLQTMRERLEGTRLTVQTGVRCGPPAAEILAAAAESDVSLIVLTSHGRTGPRRWLLGSVADAVVRGAACPVLLVSTRALAAQTQMPFTVGELMTRDLAAVRADELVTSALRKLVRHHVSGAPVVDAAGRLAGVLSEHDLLAWDQALLALTAGDPGMAPDEYRRRVTTARVADVMSRTPVTVEETAPLTAAARIFVQQGLRRLPVVKDGRLVGLLTRADVLRALTAQLDAVEATPGTGT